MTYVHALKGGAWAIEFIAERTEGKITQPIEVSPFAEVDWDKLNQLTVEELRANFHNLSIPLYVRTPNGANNANGADKDVSLKQAIADWKKSSKTLRESMSSLFETLENTVEKGDHK